MANNPVDTIFVSFGAGRTGWRQAVKRISKEAQATGMFSQILCLDEIWLQDAEPTIYRIVKKFQERGFHKGFGYMTWKPAVLRWAKLQYPKANVLYMDAGSHLEQSQDHMNLFKKILVENADTGLAWKLPSHKEFSWSKKELLVKLNPSEKILNSDQIQSGFIYIPNGTSSTELISQWNDLAAERDGFYFSHELELEQHQEFVAHRHDQSVFSILWKTHKFGIKDDMTFPENLGNFPIVAMRNNTRISAKSPRLIISVTKNTNALQDKILRRR